VRRPEWLRRRPRLVSIIAVIVLLGAALAPGLVQSGSGLAVIRLPIEVLIALAVLQLLPWRRARRVLAAIVALSFFLVILSSALDDGFESILDRRFDDVSDWPEVVDAYGVLRDSTGMAVGVLVLVALVLAAALVFIAVTWSLLRVDGVIRRHRRGALIAGSTVTAAWAILALVGAQIVPGLPIAAADGISTVASRTNQVSAAIRVQSAFDRAGADDGYANLPASDLLTGLKGKDVILAFIESYGQVAIQNTSYSKGVDAVLERGNAALAKDGYSERSAFLESSTFGGISWLAHSTLQTGLWVDNQQKYDQVTAGNRFTLSDAFTKAGWRTLSDVPSDTKPWPVGSSFYHYGTLLNATNVGYRGPAFSYARIPDQYTWAYVQSHELAQPHKPLMAEIDFVSSHTPWTPLPHMVPWSAIGNGSIYDSQPAEGLSPSVVWKSQQHVQELYSESIQYTMSSLFSFLTTFDDPNLVLIVVGDHQPHTEVSGPGANHDVPISIISKDPSVIARTSAWRWQAGMLPSSSAPVWRMDAFRDKFLAAFSAGG
jgi:hypothetical protein